jgi:1-deoxy-D-xylulose-5-phosphate synthase
LANSMLENIKSPADLKKLELQELPQLAEELRQKIIETVSKTGGHLASNLGVVELSIVLNYIFDFSEDRIIWDVGHQAYSHKLLTGRQDQFPTLRQYKGMSGFPRIDESPYDHFGTGHAGTSISAALGMAVQRDLQGKKHSVVAVVGDGSMTAGLNLEGLNQAGHLDRNMIIVLNSNDMSIAPNVGAMSGYLNKIMHGRALNKMRIETELLLKNIPTVGPAIIQAARTTEHAIKRVFVPGSLFEELGLKYVGPVDGHDIDRIYHELQKVKDLDGPVLFHVNTVKGKGYPIAEANPEKWHGAGKFVIETGADMQTPGAKPQPPAYTDFFADAVVKLMEEDKNIIAITAAMPGGTGLNKAMKKMPDRVFDVGIAEQFAVTFAAGIAASGTRPICALYSTFVKRAFDQVFHDVCLQDLPVVLAMDRAGLVGADGSTHHGIYDISFLRSMPNIILMAPKDEDELRKMLKTALKTDHPTAIRYPRMNAMGVKLNGTISTIKIGQAERLREGNDATLIAYGSMVAEASRLAEMFDGQGVSLGVINARFAKPLDEKMILDVARQGQPIITMEEGVITGGFGSAVLELLGEKSMLAETKILRLALPDRVIHHGSRQDLLKECDLDFDSMAARIREFLDKKSDQS